MDNKRTENLRTILEHNLSAEAAENLRTIKNEDEFRKVLADMTLREMMFTVRAAGMKNMIIFRFSSLHHSSISLTPINVICAKHTFRLMLKRVNRSKLTFDIE